MHDNIANGKRADPSQQIQEQLIQTITNKDSVWATIIGLTTTIIGATGVFIQLQKSLNIIWEVKAKPHKSGIWTFIKVRLFSFGMILSIAFLLVISLVISTLLSAAGEWAVTRLSDSTMVVFNVLNFVV